MNTSLGARNQMANMLYHSLVSKPSVGQPAQVCFSPVALMNCVRIGGVERETISRRHWALCLPVMSPRVKP